MHGAGRQRTVCLSQTERGHFDFRVARHDFCKFRVRVIRRFFCLSAERWSVRTLRERINSMLYERTALSQKPEETIAQELAILRDAQRMTPALVMRAPYILDFLGLRDSWQESDLEAAIIREMETFLLELGAGFCYVARQKRIQIDDDDFHLDLLFYNRKLRRLVAVELKVGEFKAAYKGQMELYLRGSTSTNGSRRKLRRWGSFFALARSPSRSNCSNWTSQASTLLST